MYNSASAKWTAIVLTCRNEQIGNAFQKEMEIRRDKGEIDDSVILLSVEDPKSEVGSGGATLNALLVVAEHISAKQGYMIVNSDVLFSSLILIVHTGRSYPFDACGRAFVSLPMCQQQSGEHFSGIVTNLDLLLTTVTTKLAVCSPPGVWVCSSDMFLNISTPVDAGVIQQCDTCLITVPATIDYAHEHGVCKLDSAGCVKDILYRCRCNDTLRRCTLPSLPDGLVPLVSGVVYLSARVAERLLSCHVLPPLDSCTYLGLDSGATPISLSLFFDVLLALCVDMTEDRFIDRGLSASLSAGGDNVADSALVRSARRLVWRQLKGFSMKALITDGKHSYMDLSAENHLKHMILPPVDSLRWTFTARCHSHITPGSSVAEDAVVINSIIGDEVHIESPAAIVHCNLTSLVRINSGCLVAGLNDSDMIPHSRCIIKKDMIVFGCCIRLPLLPNAVPQRISVVFGKHDNLQSAKTFCNKDFDVFLRQTGIQRSDLWDDTVPVSKRSLLNARLYPFLCLDAVASFAAVSWSQDAADSTGLLSWRSSWRLSLQEIMSLTDIAAEITHRRNLFFDVAKLVIVDTLVGRQHRGLNGLYNSSAVEGYAETLCSTLDHLGAESKSAGVAARTLANIADVLGAMSRGAGGLRSGPACNSQWNSAFQLLENNEISRGFHAMAVERQNWLTKPARLVRAARHYEGAAQILIRHAVMSARQFIHTTECDLTPLNKWASASCPARVDVAGGWSDTPPITYEHGGAVVNVAITVDGKKPVGARARRIDRLEIVLHIQDGGTLVLTCLDDLRDFNQPHVPGALLKAALICAKVVDFPSDVSLKVQLQQKYCSGIEIEAWSLLPHGSGLGTSSILAGAVVAVLWRATGRMFDIDSLNHAVLHVEQMLTTGGGWQDQVGGLSPGIKVGHSNAELPVKVDVTYLKVSDEVVESFGDQLVLVYTGKTRLARNLLQNVVRNWYARDPEIVETENRLVDNAWRCAAAFERGDLAGVGSCMSDYWQLKKRMAPGCEPELVTRIMSAMEPHVLGMSLAGAGGGGFMYLLTKKPGSVELVRDILTGVEGADDAQVHTASVDQTGLQLTVDDIGPEQIDFKLPSQHQGSTANGGNTQKFWTE